MGAKLTQGHKTGLCLAIVAAGPSTILIAGAPAAYGATNEYETSDLIHSFAELAGRVMFWLAAIFLASFFIARAWLRGRARKTSSTAGHVGAPVGPQWQFNPPPGWPPTPRGFVPTPGWQPDASWPSAPPGWQWWQLTT